jgi:methionine biosynthesis protein MetW
MTERLDHRVIAAIVSEGAKVLDLGCGDGELLELLRRQKDAQVRGVELNEQSIYQCVSKGLSVVHSDLDSGLNGYPDHSFDFVILNQSLQQVRNVELVLRESLRVSSRVIVGFPNFAVWNARAILALTGRTPVTDALPYGWYDTPNLRFLTLKDFKEFCTSKDFWILESHYLSARRKIHVWPNLFASVAVLVIGTWKDPSKVGKKGENIL